MKIWVATLFLSLQVKAFAESMISEPMQAVQTAPVFQETKPNPTITVDRTQLELDTDEIVASSKTVRQFHEVLDDLLAEFGYDVKMGQVNGLKNLAIRKVEVSASLPDTYQDYVKFLVSERIRENSDIRLIHCIPCTAKTSKIVDGKIMITSPSTNIGELKRAADLLSIENFMDIVLIYHTTHMVLAFQIFKVQTNELIWTRTYNSETVKSRYQKLAIDYKQVEKSRPSEEYQPEYRFLFGLGGGAIPNVGGTKDDAGMIAFHFRGTERFDNRRSEFGLLFSAYMTLNSLITKYPTVPGTGTTEKAAEEFPEDIIVPATPEPFSLAIGFWALYAHNFLGSVETYNEVRQGIHIGAGGILALGYVAGSARLGWDMYFGRRFAVSMSGIYISPSHILVGTDTVKTKGGAGADLTLSYNL